QRSECLQRALEHARGADAGVGDDQRLAHAGAGALLGEEAHHAEVDLHLGDVVDQCHDVLRYPSRVGAAQSGTLAARRLERRCAYAAAAASVDAAAEMPASPRSPRTPRTPRTPRLSTSPRSTPLPRSALSPSPP